jgi:hypothetical protein
MAEMGGALERMRLPFETQNMTTSPPQERDLILTVGDRHGLTCSQISKYGLGTDRAASYEHFTISGTSSFGKKADLALATLTDIENPIYMRQ